MKRNVAPIFILITILAGVIPFAAFATRSAQSDRTVSGFWGSIFPDGTLVFVVYPDEAERPISDVQQRLKDAWQFFQLPPK